ncbi:MAG: hypothetical protein WD749_14705 [Phycisphaerales bacterium]
MLPASATRVERATAADALARINRQTECSILYHAAHPEHIERRLAELDREWDVDRILGTQFSCTALAGLILGVTSSRRWLLLSAVTMGFFLQHSLQGWCPPLPFWRNLGYRTAREIERERCALRAIRTGNTPPESTLREPVIAEPVIPGTQTPRAQGAGAAARPVSTPNARSSCGSAPAE